MGSSEIVTKPDPRSSRRDDALKLALIALAYFLAHKISFFFPDSAKVLMAIWPAGGVGLAALLLSPRRLWPAILVTLFAVGYSADLLAGRSAVGSLGFMTANVLESLSCAWCMTRWCGPDVRFARIREISALIFAASVLNACTALLGAGAAVLAHAESFFEFWLAWWISDGLGILLVTPLIVAMLRAERPLWSIRPGRAIEWLLFMAVWLVVSWISFEPGFSDHPVLTPHPYMLVVILAWPALRFGQRTVSAALLALAAIAILSKAVTVGPSLWGGNNPMVRLLEVQNFLAFTGIMAYLVTATYAETRDLLDALSQSEARFRVITAGSPDQILVQDRTCHSIMRRHDGAVTAESMPGKGSTFHLYLPAVHAPGDIPAPDKLAAHHRGAGRILVMDDERSVRDVLAAMLTSMGYAVESVNDGVAAVEVFSREREAGRSFCAALLDLTVPGGLGGKEAAQDLLALDSGVSLFVTSGYAEDPVMANPAAYGFKASLRKPFAKSELSQLLEKHIIPAR